MPKGCRQKSKIFSHKFLKNVKQEKTPKDYLLSFLRAILPNIAKLPQNGNDLQRFLI